MQYGRTPLHYAARENDPAIVKLLISNLADIEVRDHVRIALHDGDVYFASQLFELNPILFYPSLYSLNMNI